MLQFTQTSQKSGVQPRVWCTHDVKLSQRDSLWRILAISHINRSLVLASCAKIQLNVFIIFFSKIPHCEGWSIRRPLFCILTQERKGLFDTVYFGEISCERRRSKNWNENELALFANKQFVNGIMSPSKIPIFLEFVQHFCLVWLLTKRTMCVDKSSRAKHFCTFCINGCNAV